jgi:hypothetical protein
MNDSDAVPVLPSIFECYKPVERYRALTGAAGDLALAPVDVFLMSQLAACLPAPAVALDLAADATAGATAAFWASHPKVRRVIVPARGGLPPASSWRTSFADVLDGMGIDAGRVAVLDDDAGDGVIDTVIRRQTGPPGLRRVLVSLSMPCVVTEALRPVLTRLPGAIGLAFPIGPVGGSPHLEGLLLFCSANDRRLVLFREASPFLAASQLAAICAPDEPVVERLLEWIRTSFGGNFQFLSLLRTVTEQAIRLRSLEVAGAAGPAHGHRGKHHTIDADTYGRLVEQVRDVAAESVPEGATVLVVSKGDENLLALDGQRGWHFPQTPDGVYAGHHPADGPAAVKHLRRLRAKGAGYLLIPAPFFWWLEHYTELRRYLEANGRVVACRPETCVIYDLRPRLRCSSAAGKSREADPARAPVRKRSRRRVNE